MRQGSPLILTELLEREELNPYPFSVRRVPPLVLPLVGETDSILSKLVIISIPSVLNIAYP